MPKPPRGAALPLTAATAAAIGVTLVIAVNHDVDKPTLLFGVGLVLLLTAAVAAATCIVRKWLASIRRLVKKRTKSSDAVFDTGYAIGERYGYRQGRRVGRPTVVSIDPDDDSG